MDAEEIKMKIEDSNRIGKTIASLLSTITRLEEALKNAKEKSQTLSDDRKRALGVIFRQEATVTRLTEERITLTADLAIALHGNRGTLIAWLKDKKFTSDQALEKEIKITVLRLFMVMHLWKPLDAKA